MLTMTQVMRCIRDPNLSQRDKQLLKRELGAELVSTVLHTVYPLHLLDSVVLLLISQCLAMIEQRENEPDQKIEKVVEIVS